MPEDNLNNLRDLLRQADPIDYAEGRLAYINYRRTLLELAEHYHYDLNPVAAAFAALSPNNDYVGNLRSLVSILDGIAVGKPQSEIIVSTYGACKDRAFRFLLRQADFLSVTKGKKTRSFYFNITEPYWDKPVTVDGHMIAAWSGKQLTMKEAVRQRIPYNMIAEDIRVLAREVNLLPNQVQAILWFTRKRLFNIVYKNQLGLFSPDNQWGCYIPADQIKRYVSKSELSGRTDGMTIGMTVAGLAEQPHPSLFEDHV